MEKKFEFVAYISNLGELIGGTREEVTKSLDYWYAEGIDIKDVFFAANATFKETLVYFRRQMEIEKLLNKIVERKR